MKTQRELYCLVARTGIQNTRYTMYDTAELRDYLSKRVKDL